MARHLERCVRAVERGAAAMTNSAVTNPPGSSSSSSAAAVLAAAPDAVAAAAAAGAGALAVARLPPAGAPAALVHHAAAALARSAGAQRRLKESLAACLRASASAVGWPPPIVSDAGDSSTWDGGFAARPEAADEACRLVAALTALQRATMAVEFEAAERASISFSSSSPAPLPPPSETPLLWAASELAAAVVEQRVAPLFLGGGGGEDANGNGNDGEVGGGAADAPEKPEWLFEAAARAAGAAGAAAAPLQPGIDAHYDAVGRGTAPETGGSGGEAEGCCRSLPAEVARAVRDELWSQVLAKRVIPRLSSLRSQALWSHFVSEAAAFERRLAVARGLGSGGTDEDGEVGVDAAWPDADGGILSRLCCSSSSSSSSSSLAPASVTEWRDSWWECDREAGVRAVEDAAGSGKGGEWHAAAGAAVAAAAARAEDEAALGGGDFGNNETISAAVLPSSLEFAPPPVAEAASRALAEAASRVAWLPSWSPAAASSAEEGEKKKKRKKKPLFLRTPSLARPRYVDAAARPVLAAFRSRASRAAEAAARFGDPLADPTRAAVVGGVASGARWLEHELREGGWPLLLLDEGCCSPMSSPPATSDGGNGSENGSKPSKKPPRPSVLALEADLLAALSRKWTMRLAKSAADAFENAARPAVRQAVGGYSFLLSNSPNAEADDESASYFVASGPTPALAPALAALADALAAAARALDYVAFRSVWRGAAAASTRFLFNEVATEARFDGAGGRQLAADAAALAGVFAPYAPRNPGAHVRELAEAAALLSLPSSEASRLKVAVRGAGGGGAEEAVAALRSVGVSRLSPDQAAAVLARRVF